jgi:hypothetical protein
LLYLHSSRIVSLTVSFTIPDGVTIIGGSALYSCSSLTSVTIPSTVTSIQSRAFNGSNLTSVTFEGDTIANLNNDAFSTHYGKIAGSIFGYKDRF